MHIDRQRARELGQDTLQILRAGAYIAPSGRIVKIQSLVTQAVASTRSYPPDAAVAKPAPGQYVTSITVTNASTLTAARGLIDGEHRPAALNFASATHPGGGFLSGARAQEESLARASALYACLEHNPMYAWHQARRDPLYSDYALYSPDVPVFREDDGRLLEQPFSCTFITCAAVNSKVALEIDPRHGPAIRAAMAPRIERVLAIGAAHGHTALILGAWGCGAFHNDPNQIASLFKAALDGPYRGTFATVVFAILDWSPESRFIGPFERAFGGQV